MLGRLPLGYAVEDRTKLRLASPEIGSFSDDVFRSNAASQAIVRRSINLQKTVASNSHQRSNKAPMQDLALGLDVGTSAVRAAAVGADGMRIAFAEAAMPPPLYADGSVTQNPNVWWEATRRVLESLAQKIDLKRVMGIAVDGTSGTILGVDADGQPVAPAQMYNSQAPAEIFGKVDAIAPAETAARGPTSALARAIAIQNAPGVIRLIHQADWLAGQFSGRFDVTDENNALKTGYDPIKRCWPAWIVGAGMRRDRLPIVVPAGSRIGSIAPERARALGFSSGVAIVAGTTDGCAAFWATGAETIGQAVTSLGTTLVIKALSGVPLFAPDLGIYSHRIGDAWLVGGASNSGGAALARHFDLGKICELSEKMTADAPTGFYYYPLAGRGERFPICCPTMETKPEPRPDEDIVFLQALMEGVTSVEKLGYRLVTAIGGPVVTSIRTVGGGAKNPAWRTIRARMLDIPLVEPSDDEAAVGVAKLARLAL